LEPSLPPSLPSSLSLSLSLSLFFSLFVSLDERSRFAAEPFGETENRPGGERGREREGGRLKATALRRRILQGAFNPLKVFPRPVAPNPRVSPARRVSATVKVSAAIST